MKPSLVWFRLDLRLADNPALQAAIQKGGPIIPIFIWAPDEESPWAPGAASRWWLHQSLTALQETLRAVGSHLILRKGPTLPGLQKLIKETGADAVFWNRRYEPAVIARDRKIKEILKSNGAQCESFNSALLFEPWTVQNKSGKPFQVFTPYWRSCLNASPPALPVACPKNLLSPASWPESVELDELRLEPKIHWTEGLEAAWTPGEVGAQKRLETFLSDALRGYPESRNRPDEVGSSRLSPHLHFGEIGPRQIWQAIQRTAVKDHRSGLVVGAEVYLKEIGWREFAHHLLYHFPKTPVEPLHQEFQKFPWNKNPRAIERWKKGQTGYSLVDAGMRELWGTGWMHNRVRMIAASFLVKDLLISWQEGARWFWDTLVDADLASNTLGWQWVAGCGADAAPYYRVFNPLLQAVKFDPKNVYANRWIPELSSSYPSPMIEHAIGREQALKAFYSIKRIYK